MNEPKYGSGTFLRRARISGPVMRALEEVGIITPVRSDRGWRMFSESDLQAVAQWKANRRRAAKK